MRKKTCVLLVVFMTGLIASECAIAEIISVPCEEFVSITGKRLACDKTPTIKMPAERWEKEKATAEARNAPDADIPPWERDVKPQAQPATKTLSDTDPCSAPPWKRPAGAKCD